MGATEDLFHTRATAHGLQLRRRVSFPWLTSHGHIAAASPLVPRQVIEALRAIYLELGGEETLLQRKRKTLLPVDFVDSESGCIIEIDETQHFTSDRLRTFSLYPDGVELAFDLDLYKRTIHRWRAKADGYRAAKPAADFPWPGGRRAQRAYFDAVRDLLAPFYATQPIMRVIAPDCDGVSAFTRFLAAA
jgi:hypothetical protein